MSAPGHACPVVWQVMQGPAPLLTPGMLHAPRTSSLGDGMGLSHGMAGQPGCSCQRFGAGTGRVLWPVVPESCAGECAQGLSMSPGTLGTASVFSIPAV